MSFLNSLNLNRCHGNLDRSILKFDTAKCDPLINEKVTKFEEKIFHRFLVILEKPLEGPVEIELTLERKKLFSYKFEKINFEFNSVIFKVIYKCQNLLLLLLLLYYVNRPNLTSLYLICHKLAIDYP